MATTTRQSCVSLRDHQIQVSSLVTDKITLEKQTKVMEDNIYELERKNSRLVDESSGLHGDINSLLQVITRARGTGHWETEDLTFSIITPEQLFGPVLSTSRQSSPSLKESHHDYFHHLLDEPLKKENSSAASSFSNLPDVDGSTYGGQSSEKTLLVLKLRADVQNLQSLHEDATNQLLERDKQIADLQSQLTEMKHVTLGSRAEGGGTNHPSQELQNQKKHDSVEITHREMIHNILSKKSAMKDEPSRDSSSHVWKSYSLTGNHGETELSENIDVLVSRLAELEGECQQLQEQHKALQDSHSLCGPTISMLKEQLNRSNQTQVELRTVLTAEVAQRHDQLVALHDELKEHEQKQHETVMQLQLKNEIIKDLRREIKVVKENYKAFDKSDLTPVKEDNTSWEYKCAETQTFEALPNMNGISSEQLSRTSSGCYSNASQSTLVSKLENELAEKSILLRELQSHLASSRQELHLKDETLYKLEQKLDSSRRDGGEKGERMHYLTSQLTNLQLEVGRTHGQAEQLRRQLGPPPPGPAWQRHCRVSLPCASVAPPSSLKSLTPCCLQECSSRRWTWQETLHCLLSKHFAPVKPPFPWNSFTHASEQRLAISALQDALVSSKRSCDELRARLSSDVSDSMLHHSHSQQMHNCSNNPLASTASSSVTKSISVDTLSMQPPRDTPDACVNDAGVTCNPPTTATAASVRGFNSNDSVNNDPASSSEHSNTCVPQSIHLQDDACLVKKPPELKSNYQCAKEATTQTASSAFAPDVLSSCNGSSFIMNVGNESSPLVNYVESDQTTVTALSPSDNLKSGNEKNRNFEEGVGESQRYAHNGQIYDTHDGHARPILNLLNIGGQCRRLHFARRHPVHTATFDRREVPMVVTFLVVPSVLYLPSRLVSSYPIALAKAGTQSQAYKFPHL
ncbi:hypothetical protein GWK47_002030 [Chionoecetes opilio]|uniref:Uncharacterized protein n=1 Tax=Chionoecetes opilio TaxID=41210 RepID=A0A8J4Y018_CHIOP|nr:hypothetical protein GWK47_002030 [Chionoecetes opilio]